ncbi:MAG: AsmA family protein [Pseudomonadota bacterium]
MRRILLMAGAGISLLVVAAAVVPFLVPNSVYKDQIENAATNALGRDVTLEGTVGLSIFPRISASIDGVTVANPDGFSREHIVQAGTLRGVVRWAPLLSRRVEVAEISFVDADVMLERRADGAVNWEFASAPAEPSEPSEPSSGGGLDGGIDRARLQNARLVFDDGVAGTRYEISELNLDASLQSLDAPLDAQASGLFQGVRFDIDLDLNSPQQLIDGAATDFGLNIDTDGGAVSYDGAVTLAETPALDGAFSVDGRNLTQLATLAGVDVPINLAALGRLSASGTVSGPIETAQIQFERVSLGGSGLDGAYSGGVALGETVSVDGQLDVESANLGLWLSELGLDLPETVSILERIDLSTAMEGPVDALSLSETALSHRGRLLTADFNGAARLGQASSLDGRVSASSNDLRALLTALEIEIAEGETLQSFDVSGTLEGSLSRVSITGLNAQLDDIGATGALAFILSGPRPKLTGDLTTGTLDLSPFLTTSDAPAETNSGGWSDAPLDLSGLRGIDTDIALKADQIILGDISLGQPDLSVMLENGDLAAQISSMRAFGGQWAGLFGVDASGDIATMDMDLTGETIQLSDALLSFTGLDALSGIGQLNVDVSSRGNSIKALVEGLTGDIGTNVANGAVKGINVGQLVRSRNNLVEALASGSLQMALEPEAETDFTSLLAGLALENGIASIESFRLNNPVLSLEGSGSINLVNRTLDVGIVPRLDATGQASGSALQLNGIPIPFRVRGNWMSPGLAPDTQMVQSILRQDVETRARDALQDEIGEELGGLLDGVLGTRGTQRSSSGTPSNGAAPATDPGSATPSSETQAAPAERSREQVVEDLARDALGDLFGSRRNRQQTPEPADDADTPADPDTDPNP